MCELKRLLVGVMLMSQANCLAITWGDSEVDDPIDPKHKCQVNEPLSSGSYIYHSADKFDQVFWPLTDKKGIWFCRATGFTAFIGDFEDITDVEKKEIAEYLRNNYEGGDTQESKLKLLEGIYAIRKTSEEFDNRLVRVLARSYQNLGDFEKANEYRRRALNEIQTRLKGALPEGRKLEYLYVAANYTKQFGDTESSDEFVRKLRASIANLEDKDLASFAEYLDELIGEIPKITPGGRLEPTE